MYRERQGFPAWINCTGRLDIHLMLMFVFWPCTVSVSCLVMSLDLHSFLCQSPALTSMITSYQNVQILATQYLYCATVDMSQLFTVAETDS